MGPDVSDFWPGFDYDERQFETDRHYDEWQFSWGELQGRAQIANRVGIVMFDDEWPSHSFPGCYPIGYLTDDGEWLCGTCMNDPTNPIHFRGYSDGWRIDAADIIEECEYDTHCGHCNKMICEGYLPEEGT